MRTLLVAAPLLAWVACGPGAPVREPPDALPPGTLLQEAKVSTPQAELAFALVTWTKEYIPFGYVLDGCHARALYMSMELAAREIPSSAQYLTGRLNPEEFLYWRWHAAPMIEVSGSEEKILLDPSLAPDGPVPLERWVQLANPEDDYTLTWTLGSEYYNDDSVHRNEQKTPVIDSFAALKPFQPGDISHACGTLYEYLELEAGPTPHEKRTRRELLLHRTRELVERLQQVGKLELDEEEDPLTCDGYDFPACSLADQACTEDSDCCSLRCDSGTCRARPVDLLPGQNEGKGS